MMVDIVATGLANTASVVAAFQRLGASCRLVQTVPEVDDSESLVLPGVGAFGPAMERLQTLGLIEPLRRRVLAGRPTLGICLGMQLMAESSEESLGVTGLSCFEGTVTAFDNTVNTPQFGWNEIAPQSSGTFLNEGGMVYFANSYRLKDAPNGWVSARCEYGGAFCAALVRGAVLACQFHPELSGQYGEQILSNWLNEGRRAC